MKGFPLISPLKSAQDLAAHAAAAKAASHAVPMPTHAFTRDGAIVGGVSLGGSVVVFGWFDPSLRARDTVSIINALENVCRLRGVGDALVPVATESPLLAHMEAMGYERLAPVVLFAKKL